MKTAGRRLESVAAHRRAIEMQPSPGEAYWSLAYLKTFRLLAADLLALRNALACDDLTDDERLHFEFSLGKALEDEAPYEESFAHYANGKRYPAHVARLQLAGFAQGSGMYQTSAEPLLRLIDQHIIGQSAAHALFDLSTGLERNELSLQLALTNVFDRRPE